MDRIEKYLEKLTLKSRKHLNKAYNLDEFNPSTFELINFYLLDKIINQEWNFFLQVNDPKQRNEIYRPSFLTIAIALFFKNYCNNDNIEYKAGDILQKGKTRYEYVKENANGTHYLKTSNAFYPEVSSKSLEKYAKVNAHLSNRKVKIGFKHYKNFFNQVFPGIGERLPFQFKYKAAIILDKKPFLKELKDQNFTDIDLTKAIPFQWVNKNGKFEKSKVPIDPMIYMGPDYDTIKENIIDQGINIESIIIIGKNKYKEDDLLKLKQDLRYEEVPFSILIGSEEINDDNDLFLQWKWTPEEISILNDIDQAVISSIEVSETNFVGQIVAIENFIKRLKGKYSFELPPFAKIKKFLYALALPNKEGRIANQIEYIRYRINKEFTENIKSELLNQNIDPQETLIQFAEKIDELFKMFSNIKFNRLNDIDFDFLIVPNFFEDIWKDESDFRLLSFKEFKKRIEGFTTVKDFLFLSPFGYQIYTEELLTFFRNTNHNYQFLCYPEEAQVIETLQNRHKQNVLEELSSKNRRELSDVKFSIPKDDPEPENIAELIGRISGKSHSSNGRYTYESSESVNYEIEYVDSEPIILEGSKSVLLESTHKKRRIRVSSLKRGDKIRVYSNLRKEILFDTATKQDESGSFSKIENDAQLWKQCLREYFDSQNALYCEDDLLKDLQKNGISITSNYTLRNWINADSTVKFPQKTADLYAINKCINNPILKSNLSEIIKSKEAYNGIMIALGRDLSDEVMDYILKGKKGEILSTFSDDEIQTIVNSSAPLKTISAINITEQDETE